MSAENKVPAIRFKGFSGEWESKSLGVNAEFLKGQGYSKNDLDEEGSPIILYGRLYTKYQTVISEVDTFVKNNGKSIVSKGNEVIVPASGETSEDIARASAVVKSGILLGGDLNVIYPNNKIDCVFLALTISNGKSQKNLSKRAQGKSVVHVRNADLKELEITYPSINEQTKIGNYFQQLDTLIAQHQQKHDKLLNLKKALLEKMFPKQGTKVPEIRFKGFSGEWEEKALGNVVTFVNGRAYSQDELLTKGKYPVLRVGNFYTNSSWYYSDLELGEKYYANNGDLLYTWSASFGPHIWNGGKVIYHYHIWKILLSQKLECSFLLHVLNKDRENILAGSNGSTMIHITKEGMEKKSILIPEIKEQNKIGGILDSLDTLINQHQSQLKKLNNIKQACLEKMFV